MKVGAIRDAIDRSAWHRRDLSGYTREEFIRADVAAILTFVIGELEALPIAPRFVAEEERRAYEIDRCRFMIDHWKALRVTLVLPVTGSLRPEVSQPPASRDCSRGEASSATVQERNVFSDADILAMACQTTTIQ